MKHVRQAGGSLQRTVVAQLPSRRQASDTEQLKVIEYLPVESKVTGPVTIELTDADRRSFIDSRGVNALDMIDYPVAQEVYYGRVIVRRPLTAGE